MKIVIAVAYHKPSVLLNHKYLMPIQLGRKVSNIDLGIIRDDTGENISEKDELYCELTKLYWLWKNVDADYKGIFHYRRCFANVPFFAIKKNYKTIIQYINSFLIPFGIKEDAIITQKYTYKHESDFEKVVYDFCDKLDDIFEKGTRVIAPSPIKFLSRKVVTHFASIGYPYLRALESIVKSLYPHIYPYYKKTLYGHVVYYANMSIMDNATFEEYCNFLFTVLKAHEDTMIKDGMLQNLLNEKIYYKIPGYMGELLTSTFILYCKNINKIIKEVPVAFLDAQ